MAVDDNFEEIQNRPDEEGFFSRDTNGQLNRFTEATAKDYDKMVTVTIDGQAIEVPLAVPLTDSQGNFVEDSEGLSIPRKTTILDAAQKLYRKDDPSAELPIPTLCHADHLHPVGVCRICSVGVAKIEADRKNPGKTREVISEKLVPACVQPVEPNMIVHTMRSKADQKLAARVQNAVKVLLELLAADHLSPASNRQSMPAPSSANRSELATLVQKWGGELNIKPTRVAPRQPLQYRPDTSSQLIAVDHNACILCDRCSRSCNDIKHNYVIGRSGKGYTTRIGFDLNDLMGDSSCVSCGECMLSCPTNALTFLKPVESDWWRDSLEHPHKQAVTPEELETHPLLGCLPFRFRQFNQSAIVRWNVEAGDELCRLGEYGTTAFLLNSGEFDVFTRDPRTGTTPTNQGFFGAIAGMFGNLVGTSHKELGEPQYISTPDDLILGELSCLSQFPRMATVRARTDGEVFEIRRNVLYALQRNPQARDILDRVYRERSLRRHLEKVKFFENLSAAERDECRGYLSDKVQLLHVDPGQTIFRQGADPDAYYMVRYGYVKFTQTMNGQERVLNYFGPDRYFGEIGLLSDDPEIAAILPESIRSRRTATATALDDVELVKIARPVFQKMLRRFPPLRQKFLAIAKQTLERQNSVTQVHGPSQHLKEFTEQGLFNGQRLLVLDLEACTRCDECSKACADTHEGVTRLIRDGLRFDKWLVASSCRSCSDPYCLVGCPVDAIHREGGRKEITIENHCIGCGLCANNCPYGNINMHSEKEYRPDANRPERTVAVLQQKATTCDLCQKIVGPNDDVSCVYACPHNAAFRMSGEELFDIVKGNTRK